MFVRTASFLWTFPSNLLSVSCQRTTTMLQNNIKQRFLWKSNLIETTWPLTSLIHFRAQEFNFYFNRFGNRNVNTPTFAFVERNITRFFAFPNPKLILSVLGLEKNNENLKLPNIFVCLYVILIFNLKKKNWSVSNRLGT